ncbi:hypothetical protein PNK_0623 [Candidatus Protochlamydia naegleriophila]|uniref:Uncharacterized protein n=1 Tax=Candidatus Protochlamydia naegleriophila TaxID=389348 RepID=A0A0U5JBQ6_9BACT|nr:hypothetical protein PNK_0623 [Candidatus Protochlamydia naegleriophila]
MAEKCEIILYAYRISFNPPLFERELLSDSASTIPLENGVCILKDKKKTLPFLDRSLDTREKQRGSNLIQTFQHFHPLTK